MAKAKPNNSLAPISTNEVYPVALFRQLVGLDEWAWKEAKRHGLRVCKVGRRVYVRGADWDNFLAQQVAP